MEFNEIVKIWYNVRNFNETFIKIVTKGIDNIKYEREIITKLSYFYIDLINYYLNTDNILEIILSLKEYDESYDKLKEMIIKQSNRILKDSNIERLNKALELFQNYKPVDVEYKIYYDNNKLIIEVTCKEVTGNQNLIQGKKCEINMSLDYIKLYNLDGINFISSYLLYDCMNLDTQAWSIAGPILEKMKKEYNPEFECFSHSFNTLLHKRFCSRFWKYEKNFGSVGNFFQIDLETLPETRFFVNPPYTEKVLNDAAIKVVDTLNKTKKKLTFILMYPNWGDEIVPGSRPVEYDEILNCKYLKERLKISKDDYHYYDHINDKIVQSRIAFKIIYILQN